MESDNPTTAKVTGLIPMTHAADVQRSVDFYKQLGMEIRGSLRDPAGYLQWVHLTSEQADLMFARASEPVIASQQAVLFYLYSPDLIALREHLLASGVKVSAITHPEYMPKGEIRVEDPDGYVLLIGQAG
jgi:catechol 2,3-dioxygenase-like lactoylglutathione lyase family enzyme